MSQKSVIIVESPSKARTISKYLDDQYEVVACVGHVKDLPRGSLGVDVDNDFQMELVILDDKKDFFKTLTSQAKSAPEIILATDPDREGEAIAAHIASEVPNAKISRVQFTEITNFGVNNGMKHKVDIDENLVEAQRTRRIIDRLVGYKISKVLWITLQKNMNFVKQSLSAGRVQSAALKIIIDRERRRAKFKKVTYFGLTAQLMTEKREAFNAKLLNMDSKRIAKGQDFDQQSGELKKDGLIALSHSQAKALVDEINPGPWVVSSVEEKPKTSNPKPPFTTSTLQQEAARKLKFSTRKTMGTAQRLYEAGLITYMRTDSINLSDEAINASRDIIKKDFGSDYLPDSPRQYKGKVKNAQEAHEAIRPAGRKFKPIKEIKDSMGTDESNLYELIWKRTIASQMKSAQLKQTSITIKNQNTEFRASGQVILFAGYMEVYVESRDDPKVPNINKENILPELKENDHLSCDGLSIDESTTKPPARFTEASLVKEMEADGIGRPSTYSSIINKIQQKDYVRNNKGSLTPTFLAFAVTQLLENHFNPLVDIKFTAEMEDALDAIARGEQNSLPFMKKFYFGSDSETGLLKMLDEKIDIPKACIIPLNGDEKEPIIARVGNYGPYIQQGDVRRNIPDILAPGDMTIEKAIEILNETPEKEDKELGADPETGQIILLKVGPYGPYVQLGDTKTRKSIPKNVDLDNVNIEYALSLLSLPRNIGDHPEHNEPIFADYGRFGPYIKMGKQNASLRGSETPLDITLEKAVELLANRNKKSATLRSLGSHPESKEEIIVKDGRYGPYVSDGKINASLNNSFDPESITLEQATELINEKRAKGPTKRKRRKKKK